MMRFVNIATQNKSMRLIAALLLAAVFLSLIATPAHAQSPVYAEVDRTRLSTGETLKLTVVIQGSVVGEPDLPVLDGFQVVGRNSSSQLSIINGVVTANLSYIYILAPTRDGILTIPPVPVTLDGNVYATQPITIEVTAGAAPAQPVQPVKPIAPSPPSPDASQGLVGQDVYVAAAVDNPNPYVGEQVVYTFRFYRAKNFFDQPSYEGPSFSGFWTEGETQQYDYDIQAAGRNYRVVELQTTLFPTSAGEQTVDAATLTIPGGFFSRGNRLQTDALTLNVRPTPEPAPDGFRGAVGQYSISASVDNDHVQLNEPITLKVIVSGEGNIHTLPDPQMPIMDGWRAFEATSTVQTDTQGGLLVGTRTTEQLLVPGLGGDFTIPAIHYTYFDPSTESYQTTSSDPIDVNVAEGAGILSGAAPVSQTPGGGTVPVSQLDSDIRHIKSVPQNLSEKSDPLVFSPLYWVLWLVPLGALVLDEVWGRRKRFQANNPDLVRSSKAAKGAYHRLARARKQKADPYSAVGTSLTTYLGDRFNHPVTGMTHTGLRGFLESKGVPPSLVKRISETLMWSEMGRFGAVDPNDCMIREMYDNTKELIARLEKVLG